MRINVIATHRTCCSGCEAYNIEKIWLSFCCLLLLVRAIAKFIKRCGKAKTFPKIDRHLLQENTAREVGYTCQNRVTEHTISSPNVVISCHQYAGI